MAFNGSHKLKNLFWPGPSMQKEIIIHSSERNFVIMSHGNGTLAGIPSAVDFAFKSILQTFLPKVEAEKFPLRQEEF